MNHLLPSPLQLKIVCDATLRRLQKTRHKQIQRPTTILMMPSCNPLQNALHCEILRQSLRLCGHSYHDRQMNEVEHVDLVLWLPQLDFFSVKNTYARVVRFL